MTKKTNTKTNNISFIDVSEINKQLSSNAKKVVLDAESNYRGQLFRVAKRIVASNNKIVLLAGPSCAGKTTSATLLKQILERRNKHVITISMDDFFVDREQTPKLPDGSFDFDSINTVNLDQMEKCFKELFTKGKAKFPRFSFLDGRNFPDTFEYELKKNTIVLFEGLHVLNPELINRLGTDKVYKLYAEPMIGFKYKETNLVPRNLRLVRRIVRDVERRGHSPELTLSMWQNVTDAENVYIEPFKETADFVINTTHAYEMGIFKKELKLVIDRYPETKDALPFLAVFENSELLNKQMLPDTSLMWEFIDKY